MIEHESKYFRLGISTDFGCGMFDLGINFGCGILDNFGFRTFDFGFGNAGIIIS